MSDIFTNQTADGQSTTFTFDIWGKLITITGIFDGCTIKVQTSAKSGVWADIDTIQAPANKKGETVTIAKIYDIGVEGTPIDGRLDLSGAGSNTDISATAGRGA